MIIEGVHIVPGLMKLEEFREDAYLIPVVISTLNKSDLFKRFPARQIQAPRRPAEHYREHFKSILRIQDYILDMAEDQETPIVENENLDETVSSTLTVITNSLREQLDIRSEDLVSKAL